MITFREGLIQQGQADIFFAFEVMVEGAFGDAGGGQNVVECGAAVAVAGEEAAGGVYDAGSGFCRGSCHETDVSGRFLRSV